MKSGSVAMAGLGVESFATNRAMQGLDSLLEASSGSFGVLAAGVAAVVAVLGTGKEAVDTFTDTVGNLFRASETFGVTAEQAQAFGTSLKQVGLDESTMQRGLLLADNSLQKVTQDLSEGKTPTGTFVEGLKAIGLSATTSSGQVKSMGDLVPEIFASFSSTAAQAKATGQSFDAAGVAGELFGRRMGGEMVPALEQVNGSFEENAKRAAELGQGSAENQQKYLDWAKATADLDEDVNALKVDLGSGLLPIITDSAKAVGGWIDNLKFLSPVADLVGEGFNRFGKTVQVVLAVVDFVIGGVIADFGLLAQGVGHLTGNDDLIKFGQDAQTFGERAAKGSADYLGALNSESTGVEGLIKQTQKENDAKKGAAAAALDAKTSQDNYTKSIQAGLASETAAAEGKSLTAAAQKNLAGALLAGKQDAIDLAQQNVATAAAEEGLGAARQSSADKVIQLQQQMADATEAGHSRTADALKQEIAAYASGDGALITHAQSLVTTATAADAAADKRAAKAKTAADAEIAATRSATEAGQTAAKDRESLSESELDGQHVVTEGEIAADAARVESTRGAAERQLGIVQQLAVQMAAAINNPELLKNLQGLFSAAQQLYQNDAAEFTKSQSDKKAAQASFDAEQKAEVDATRAVVKDQVQARKDATQLMKDDIGSLPPVWSSALREAEGVVQAADANIASIDQQLTASLTVEERKRLDDLRAGYDAERSAALDHYQELVELSKLPDQTQHDLGLQIANWQVITDKAAAYQAALQRGLQGEQDQIAAVNILKDREAERVALQEQSDLPLTVQADQMQVIIDRQQIATQGDRDRLSALQDQSSEIGNQISEENDLLTASGGSEITDGLYLQLKVKKDMQLVAHQDTRDTDKALQDEQNKLQLGKDQLALAQAGQQRQKAADDAAAKAQETKVHADDALIKSSNSILQLVQETRKEHEDELKLASDSSGTTTTLNVLNSQAKTHGDIVGLMSKQSQESTQQLGILQSQLQVYNDIQAAAAKTTELVRPAAPPSGVGTSASPTAAPTPNTIRVGLPTPEEARAAANAVGTASGQGLAAGLSSQAAAVQTQATTISTAVPDAVKKSAGAVQTAATGVGTAVTTGITSGSEPVGAKIQALTPDVLTPLTKLEPLAADAGQGVGQNISDGIARGISTFTPYVERAARGAVDAAIDAAREEADAHSPSRRAAEEIGHPLSEGVAVGITAGAGLMSTAMSSAIGGVFGQAGGAPPIRGFGGVPSSATAAGGSAFASILGPVGGRLPGSVAGAAPPQPAGPIAAGHLFNVENLHVRNDGDIDRIAAQVATVTEAAKAQRRAAFGYPDPGNVPVTS